jgi:iron complex transport system ATP-binding protein
MPPNYTDNFVKTEKLTLGYSSLDKDLLFTDLNLSLKGGELVCFMGSNGIGKSTLIRTLAGLQKPRSGRVSFPGNTNGVEIERWMSLVLTDRITASTMTVYELISYGRYPFLNWNLTLSANDERIIEEAIRATQIESLSHKSVNELSDGQMQLAMIARALAQDTPVILLDEPTAHLDLNNRIEVMRLLRNVARTMKKAVLVATHELDLALQMADVLWLATPKKQIEVGTPEDLVLTGILDEIFRLKGFDLKTGKVSHEPYRNTEINLRGKDYEFLWTKNALDREGYSIEKNASIGVEIIHDGEKLGWLITTRTYSKSVFSIKELLAHLTIDL